MKPIRDPHSAFVARMPQMTHLHWEFRVDFESRKLRAIATIEFDRGDEETVLDTRGLHIANVQTVNGDELRWDHHDAPARGRVLRVHVPDDRKIVILYTTSPEASGLQWLTAEQTAGKRHSCVYSQGQALHTSSFVPCQNTPSVRFTFTARGEVDRGMRLLMGATHQGIEPCRIGTGDWEELTSIETWRMDHPIPAYLLSFVAGDFAFRDLSPRCRVYAEPELIDAAARDLASVEEMVVRFEGLFGPYPWERFDMFVAPPSFPYGGMENPQLAFLSPTILGSPESAARVAYHELLSHSFAGNLIGNATWSDFWLNEGWSTYLEWRALEMQFGTEHMRLVMWIAMAQLSKDFASLEKRGRAQYTALACHMPVDIDPDDLVTHVPYVKGALFLYAIEQAVGRERFDLFVRTYIQDFRFQAITTQQFLDYVAKSLPGVLEQVGGWNWVYGQGLPDDAPVIKSALADSVSRIAQIEVTSDSPDPSLHRIGIMGRWDDDQWHLYLELLATKPVNPHWLAWLDEPMSLSTHTNMEVRAAFLRLAAEVGYLDWDARITELLMTVGRLKYLDPIYTALARTPERRRFAINIFRLAMPGYHPVTVTRVNSILGLSSRPA